jgi:CheY-like chemotaxis protein
MLVEDSDDDFDTVVDAAIRAHVGNRLVRAADVDAARRLLAFDPADAFAFMLLDYNLPGLDGLVLLDHVRRKSLSTHLPVVVFTTSVNPRDRDVFCEAGASAFHVKSVDYADCMRTLESIFDHWLNRVAPHDGAAALLPARQSP